MEENQIENIHIITENALCSACGGCAGICPTAAISMQENAAGYILAVVDNDKCVNCHKCLSICPSNGKRLKNDLIGKTQHGYLGYATDKTTRLQGQSGGVVTALLQFMMLNKLIDGAVVSNFNCSTGRAEAFMANNLNEITAATGSHYTQTSPVQIILNNQDKRLAAVLLGCQAACLEQIAQKYARVRLPVLTIGLVCGGNLSGHIVEDLLQCAKVKSKEEVTAFRFRDKTAGGWPGNILIHTDHNILLPKEKRMELKPFYQNYRCLLCAEKMNQDCDIVVGDPWGINLGCEETGYSAIITRTDKGEEILKQASEHSMIVLQQEKVKTIVDGQRIETDLKNRLLQANEIQKKNGWRNPYNDKNVCGVDLLDIGLEHRLCFLRDVYMAESSDKACKLIKREKGAAYNPAREFLHRVKKSIFS